MHNSAVGETNLSRERILGAACEVLRRYGPAKTTVVDVARALGVSHASVYRHFDSKAALRRAVVRDWLDSMLPALQAAADAPGKGLERLHRWLRRLVELKRGRAFDDPELFATYAKLAADAEEVVKEHLDELVVQASQIVQEGVARGELVSDDPSATARALIHATVRFQHPAHVGAWREAEIDEEFERVWELLAQGLAPRKGEKK